MEHWSVTVRNEILVVVGRGHDTAGAYKQAVSTFNTLIQEKPLWVVVADLTDLKHYETDARKAWQEVVLANRERFKILAVIGADHAFVKMGVTLVGTLARVPLKFASNWGDFQKNILPNYA